MSQIIVLELLEITIMCVLTKRRDSIPCLIEVDTNQNLLGKILRPQRFPSTEAECTVTTNFMNPPNMLTGSTALKMKWVICSLKEKIHMCKRGTRALKSVIGKVRLDYPFGARFLHTREWWDQGQLGTEMGSCHDVSSLIRHDWWTSCSSINEIVRSFGFSYSPSPVLQLGMRATRDWGQNAAPMGGHQYSSRTMEGRRESVTVVMIWSRGLKNWPQA